MIFIKVEIYEKRNCFEYNPAILLKMYEKCIVPQRCKLQSHMSLDHFYINEYFQNGSYFCFYTYFSFIYLRLISLSFRQANIISKTVFSTKLRKHLICVLQTIETSDKSKKVKYIF